MDTKTVFYEVAYSSGADDKADEHVFIDNNVLIGAEYYYYVQAKAKIDDNEPMAHPSERGKIIS